MPRIPRNLILEEEFQAHKIWRGHNKEWNLNTSEEKSAYLSYLNKLLIKNSNELNSFAVMSNHSHELFDIHDKDSFSELMRNHHSKYGMFFNRKHKRQGKVAYDRPKTCLIQSDEYSMKATFYIHANPLRAGITKNAANYRWSTHKLYAFGRRDEFTKFVKFPQWYIDLGNTWKDRQKKYRRLFDAYLKDAGLIKQEFLSRYFFGSYPWMDNYSQRVKDWSKARANSPPN